ncbi:MAG: TolC family protein [Bacteroidota bacterium]
MKKIILTLIVMLYAANLGAQSIEETLLEISANNAELTAMRKSIDRQAAEYRMGVVPPDPEFEYAHMTAAGAEKTRYAVSQSFKFPFFYLADFAFADYYEETLLAGYSTRRSEILLDAKLLMIDIVYYQKMIDLYINNSANADSTLAAMKLKFETGDADRLDVMKAEIYSTRMKRRLEELRRESDAASEQLAALNGGKSLRAEFRDYPGDNIPEDAEAYIEIALKDDKELDYLWQEYILKDKEETLTDFSYIPEFSIGWENDLEPEHDFSGWKLGVSIPVFSYWNTSAEGEFATETAYAEHHRRRIELEYEYKNLYNELITVESLIEDYESSDFITEGYQLLGYSYQLGEISSAEYFLELNYFNEYADEYYNLERRRAALNAKLMKPWILNQ